MPDNGEPRGNDTPRSSGASLLHWLSNHGSFRLLLNALHSGRPANGKANTQRIGSDTSYMETCCRCALDAYTLEDAIYWHSEIVAELSSELVAVQDMNWPATIKASVCIALEDRIAQHSGVIDRLSGILQRNEHFVWQP